MKKPRVLDELIDGQPFVWFLNESPSNEILELFTRLLPTWQLKHQLLLQCLFDSLLGGLVVKGKRSTDQGISYASDAPYITGEVVWILLKHLWSDIAQRTEWLNTFLVWC